MKTKIVVLVGIALCTMLLISPALASDVGTLDIYGNANEDDTIDMRDLTYVKLIFFGKKPVTELADAKYDGKINPLDFIQMKLIIVGKEKELTVVDGADRIVTVKKPIEKIVSGNTGTIETMCSLKLEKDRIVGVPDTVHEHYVIFPEFGDHPYIETSPLDIEKTLSLNPDAVFLYGTFGDKEETKKLEDFGITVFCFDYYRPGNIYVEEIKKLGYIINKKEEAEEFINFYEGCLNTIKEGYEDIPMDKRPRVYFESYKPYRTAGKGSGYHQKLEMAGGHNIFGDISGYLEVDPEEVIKRNPEIIVKKAPKTYHAYEVDDPTELKGLRNEIMIRHELAETIAVKNERVYVFADDIYGGPRHFVCLAYLAKWFYPELFDDLDPRAIHQEYLTRFQGLDYDLDKQGVFVYPEPS